MLKALNPIDQYDDNGFQGITNDSLDDQWSDENTFMASTVAVAGKTTTPAIQNVLYLTEAGTSGPISVHDINQGQLGDCFLLSSIGEIALFHSANIMNMIHDNGNGTQNVTLYMASNGKLPTWSTTSFKATTVKVSDTFDPRSVNNGATQDVSGNQKEIWPQVLESADAALNGGINNIANGGSPVLAMEELTGKQATWTNPAALSIAALLADVKAGDLLVFDTASSGALSNGLFNNHAYMFDHVTAVSGGYTVSLDNPWGYDQPSAIAFQNLAKAGIVEVDIGHV